MTFMADREYLKTKKEADQYTKRVDMLIHGKTKLEEEIEEARRQIEQAKKTVWRNDDYT